LILSFYLGIDQTIAILKVVALIGIGGYLLNISLKNPKPDWLKVNGIRLFAVAISLIALGLLTLFELVDK
jgi:hypothetical protein